MNILDEIKNDLAGAKILKDWLGDGLRHVSQAQADHRSLACLRGNGGEVCPHNTAPNWWDTAKGADQLPRPSSPRLRSRTNCTWTTAFRRQTLWHVCDVCGCKLSTKIWVPIFH